MVKKEVASKSRLVFVTVEFWRKVVSGLSVLWWWSFLDKSAQAV